MGKLGCNCSLKEIHGSQSRKLAARRGGGRESQDHGAFKSQKSNAHSLGFTERRGCLNCHNRAVAAAPLI